MRRYQHLWLPLVLQYPEEQLIPPPDIAWLWHCHRLAPRNYAAYCKQAFAGVVLEANPPFTLQSSDYTQKASVAESTRLLWDQAYPNEAFFSNAGPAETKQSEAAPKLLCGFDLLGSTARQATFLWQVSAERFDDDDFLEEGVENYAKFLQLKQKATAKHIILVPTYQIDLIWHTHILSSIAKYNKDCKAISGGMLHHDDSLTDRSDGGVLDVSYTATKNLWNNEYGCDYVVEGGMYRGEPPKAFFASDWKSWQQDWQAGANHHLVGRMGASSTSPPTEWAALDGLTSDGKPAFIATGTTKKLQLRSQLKRTNYVLGRTNNGIGYYHIETKDANEILYIRVMRRTRALESDIACARACCQGDSALTKQKETQLTQMHEAKKVLSERCKATKPVGRTRDAASATTDSSPYYDSGGVWLYPIGLYDCAGGACGGAIVCSGGGGCGGSACGAACGGGKIIFCADAQLIPAIGRANHLSCHF